MKKILARSYYAFFLMVLFTVSAFAYLDPGTVSYVVSMIAGLFIAGGAAIAIFRRRITMRRTHSGYGASSVAIASLDRSWEDGTCSLKRLVTLPPWKR